MLLVRRRMTDQFRDRQSLVAPHVVQDGDGALLAERRTGSAAQRWPPERLPGRRKRRSQSTRWREVNQSAQSVGAEAGAAAPGIGPDRDLAEDGAVSGSYHRRTRCSAAG